MQNSVTKVRDKHSVRSSIAGHVCILNIIYSTIYTSSLPSFWAPGHFYCWLFWSRPMVQGSTADTKRSATTDNCRLFNGKNIAKTLENHGKIMGKKHGKNIGKTWENHGKNIGKTLVNSWENHGENQCPAGKNIELLDFPARHVCLFLLGTGGYGKSPLGTGPRPGLLSWTCPNDPNLSSSGDFT